MFQRTEVRHAKEKPVSHRTIPCRSCRAVPASLKYTLPYYQVVRAKMILLAADGLGNDEIASCLHTRREIVSLWRKRFFERRLAGLEDQARPGRPLCSAKTRFCLT